MCGTEYIGKKTLLGNLSIKTVIKWSFHKKISVTLNILVKEHFWEIYP